MSIVDIDTNDEKLLEKNFKLLEPGVYDFEISNKLEITKSKAGNNMIKVELMCTTEGEDTLGVKVFDNIVLTAEAKWKLAQFCKACGVESEDGKVDLDLFEGATCSAATIQENYKNKAGADKMSTKISEYLWED